MIIESKSESQKAEILKVLTGICSRQDSLEELGYNLISIQGALKVLRLRRHSSKTNGTSNQSPTMSWGDPELIQLGEHSMSRMKDEQLYGFCTELSLQAPHAEDVPH